MPGIGNKLSFALCSSKANSPLKILLILSTVGGERLARTELLRATRVPKKSPDAGHGLPLWLFARSTLAASGAACRSTSRRNACALAAGGDACRTASPAAPRLRLGPAGGPAPNLHGRPPVPNPPPLCCSLAGCGGGVGFGGLGRAKSRRRWRSADAVRRAAGPTDAAVLRPRALAGRRF